MRILTFSTTLCCFIVASLTGISVAQPQNETYIWPIDNPNDYSGTSGASGNRISGTIGEYRTTNSVHFHEGIDLPYGAGTSVWYQSYLVNSNGNSSYAEVLVVGSSLVIENKWAGYEGSPGFEYIHVSSIDVQEDDRIVDGPTFGIDYRWQDPLTGIWYHPRQLRIARIQSMTNAHLHFEDKYGNPLDINIYGSGLNPYSDSRDPVIDGIDVYIEGTNTRIGTGSGTSSDPYKTGGQKNLDLLVDLHDPVDGSNARTTPYLMACFTYRDSDGALVDDNSIEFDHFSAEDEQNNGHKTGVSFIYGPGTSIDPTVFKVFVTNNFSHYNGGSGDYIRNLEGNTKYYADIWIWDQAGRTKNSRVYFDTSPTTGTGGDDPPIQPPPVPTNCTATVSLTGYIDLSWVLAYNPYNYATEYRLYRSTSSGGVYSQIATVEGNSETTHSWTDYDVSPSAKYYYKVKAWNIIGESSFSNVSSATAGISGNITQNTTWPATGALLAGGITVKSGKTLTVSADAIVKFGAGVSLTVESGGKIIAKGTNSKKILFTSALPNPTRKSYGTFFIYSSNNQFEYCTIEFSDWGLKFVGPASGNVVKNCTFRQNDQAIRIHYNDAEVRNCLIENNRHAFVLIDNTSQYGNIYLDGNNVRKNDRDGIYSINSIVDVYRTVLDNNGLGNSDTYHGIWATSSSDFALGSRQWGASSNGGYNTIKNNRGAGIYLSTSSLVLIGDLINNNYRAGNNSIYDNGKKSGTYSGKNVYNATSTIVQADKNYWIGTPVASKFFGPIDYSNWLTSAPSGTSRPEYLTDDSDSSLSDEISTGFKDAYETSGQRTQASDTEDDTMIKRQIIQQLRALIAQQPQSAAAVEALQTIFSFIRTDRNDRLGERGGIYHYLSGLRQAHSQLELGKRAMHLMILERLGRENFGEAIELAQSTLVSFSGSQRQEVMSLLIRLWLRAGQIASAQQLFKVYKREFPADVSMHELLQDMFDHAEHDLAHASDVTGGAPAPAYAHSPNVTENGTPSEFSLTSNFPNPFNPSTEFRYELPQTGNVTLKIFNILGELVRVLIDEIKPAGRYAVSWDGKDQHGVIVASGAYVYQLAFRPSESSAQAIVRNGKMSFLR